MRIAFRNHLKCCCGVRSWLLWGVLLLCLPGEAVVGAQDDQITSAIEADSPLFVAESNEINGRALGDRRDVHTELPADANLRDVLYAYADSQANASAGGLDTGCPCRTEAPEEEAGGEPPPHPMGVIGLGFGSAILVLLAAFALWHTYATKDSPRP